MSNVSVQRDNNTADAPNAESFTIETSTLLASQNDVDQFAQLFASPSSARIVFGVFQVSYQPSRAG